MIIEKKEITKRKKKKARHKRQTESIDRGSLQSMDRPHFADEGKKRLQTDRPADQPTSRPINGQPS